MTSLILNSLKHFSFGKPYSYGGTLPSEQGSLTICGNHGANQMANKRSGLSTGRSAMSKMGHRGEPLGNGDVT